MKKIIYTISICLILVSCKKEAIDHEINEDFGIEKELEIKNKIIDNIFRKDLKLDDFDFESKTFVDSNFLIVNFKIINKFNSDIFFPFDFWRIIYQKKMFDFNFPTNEFNYIKLSKVSLNTPFEYEVCGSSSDTIFTRMNFLRIKKDSTQKFTIKFFKDKVTYITRELDINSKNERICLNQNIIDSTYIYFQINMLSEYNLELIKKITKNINILQSLDTITIENKYNDYGYLSEEEIHEKMINENILKNVLRNNSFIINNYK